ncbi:ribose-5-phosphate isomerase RpiA [Alicyclobacillus acidiphilus]|uniref:ribose-5-phosphate isomerase RpiA n=1 Tax=Alicyclobacillus acidiphilus TaxID=182455 RepID=UPI000835ABC5|nr:ribose-5-phosphate isomerase RpiA [Alicyclobacillus acidiphilus]
MDKKQLAGEAAVKYVEDGMVIGLGTGSTVYYALLKLGERVAEGLRIQGIPTSEATAELANRLHIPLTTFAQNPRLDLTIDGADSVTPDFHLIKGGGGALLREKLVAAASDRLIVIVDDSKLAQTFEGVSIPVEVVPFAWETTAARLAEIGGRWTLRMKDGKPFVTDNHNYILDTVFDRIPSVPDLESTLKRMIGVVESGLFIGMTSTLIVGYVDGARIVEVPTA